MQQCSVLSQKFSTSQNMHTSWRVYYPAAHAGLQLDARLYPKTAGKAHSKANPKAYLNSRTTKAPRTPQGTLQARTLSAPPMRTPMCIPSHDLRYNRRAYPRPQCKAHPSYDPSHTPRALTTGTHQDTPRHTPRHMTSHDAKHTPRCTVSHVPRHNKVHPTAHSTAYLKECSAYHAVRPEVQYGGEGHTIKGRGHLGLLRPSLCLCHSGQADRRPVPVCTERVMSQHIATTTHNCSVCSRCSPQCRVTTVAPHGTLGNLNVVKITRHNLIQPRSGVGG